MDQGYIGMVCDVKTFIHNQVEKSGLNPESIYYGYKLSELEERVEKIPCKDWFKILTEISDKKDFIEWYLSFQSRFNERRQGSFSRATGEITTTDSMF